MEPSERDLIAVLAQMARAASRTLDPATMLDRTLAVLDPIIGPTRAEVWLEEGRSERLVAQRSTGGEVAGASTLQSGEAHRVPRSDEVVISLEGADRSLGDLVVSTLDGSPLPTAATGLLEMAAIQIGGSLERARLFNDLMELERLKSDFINRVSHELRTPITIVNGFLDTLLAHGDDLRAEQRSHMLERAQMASARLGRLIEELLILSRIDAGVLIPTLATVDLTEMLAEVRRGAQEPEQVVISAPPGATCTTDADLLTRALGLLVDNAIKYGGIAAVEATPHEGGWTFVVRDRGAGFPIDVEATAFEMFTRSSNSTAVPGLGVGLPIARTLVEVLDGTIQIDATVDGGGASVRIDVPG